MSSTPDSAILVALGHVVRRLREKRGLSLTDVAARSSLQPDDVQSIERGESDPSILVLQALAGALDENFATLLDAARDELARS